MTIFSNFYHNLPELEENREINIKKGLVYISTKTETGKVTQLYYEKYGNYVKETMPAIGLCFAMQCFSHLLVSMLKVVVQHIYVNIRLLWFQDEKEI